MKLKQHDWTAEDWFVTWQAYYGSKHLNYTTKKETSVHLKE